MNDTYLIYLLCGAIALIFLYLIAREFQTSRDFRRIYAALAAAQKARVGIEHELRVTMQKAVDETREKSESAIGEGLRASREEITDIKIETDFLLQRLDRLEESINKYHFLLSDQGVGEPDAAKIVSLYTSGYSIDEIARQLRVSATDVAFVVRLNNLEVR
ncbi:MAG: hypothetical protein LBU73_10125 [Helicobacteraceae bacterium]|nr:hypothetical protein [Helicobacteraceae bacterium]